MNTHTHLHRERRRTHVEFTREWMNERSRSRSRSRRGSWSRHRYSYFTNMQKRTKLHGQTASSQRASTHTQTQTQTDTYSLPLSECVGERAWESQSQVYSYSYDACAASVRFTPYTLCSRRAPKVNWIRRQAHGSSTSAQATLTQPAWRAAEQLSAATATQPRRLQRLRFFWGLLWLLIVLASRRVALIIISQLLNFIMSCVRASVCVSVCERVWGWWQIFDKRELENLSFEH